MGTGDGGIAQSSAHAGVQKEMQWAQWEEDEDTHFFSSSSGFKLAAVLEYLYPFQT